MYFIMYTDRCWIHRFEYYYCAMWFVGIVAKQNPNKPHSVFNFIHIQFNKVINFQTKHIVHQVLLLTKRPIHHDRIVSFVDSHSSYGIRLLNNIIDTLNWLHFKGKWKMFYKCAQISFHAKTIEFSSFDISANIFKWFCNWLFTERTHSLPP